MKPLTVTQRQVLESLGARGRLSFRVLAPGNPNDGRWVLTTPVDGHAIEAYVADRTVRTLAAQGFIVWDTDRQTWALTNSGRRALGGGGTGRSGPRPGPGKGPSGRRPRGRRY